MLCSKYGKCKFIERLPDILRNYTGFIRKMEIKTNELYYEQETAIRVFVEHIKENICQEVDDESKETKEQEKIPCDRDQSKSENL